MSRLAPAAATKVPASDPRLPAQGDDPRVKKGRKAGARKGNGRNTESFDPRSTFVRPDFRVRVASASAGIQKKLKHDDVVVVPELYCGADDWDIYYKLVEEMRSAAAKDDAEGKKAQWISWRASRCCSARAATPSRMPLCPLRSNLSAPRDLVFAFAFAAAQRRCITLTSLLLPAHRR